jgi:regulator of sigma E protease
MAINLLLALSTADLLWWVDVIVKVAIALGTVVFVHELGHFLVAKACGVKVEKFMLGFDIGGYKIARKYGETVYGIGILPLGGYVKMFGQDDDPSHIAEQMQKSQVSAGSGDAVEKTGPNGEKYYIDRRSYLAKSVPQRMAIISAGVIMNVIFAFIFATIAYGMGVKYLPCIVSGTMPGSPAWKAGFETGDEIVELGDRKNPTFLQLKGSVTLGNLESGIPCEVLRAADGQIASMPLLPTQEKGELASVGISGPTSLDLLGVRPDSAADAAKLVSERPASWPKANKSGDADKKVDAPDPLKLNRGDTLVSVNGEPVENYRDYIAQLVNGSDKPMAIEVRRPVKGSDGKPLPVAESEPVKTELLRFELPVQQMRNFGLVMQMGPVTVVQDNSPAAKAGIRPGDRIVAVDNRPTSPQATSDASSGGAESDAGASIDPVLLPEYLTQAALEGREVEFSLRRGANAKSEGEEVKLRLTPEVPTTIAPGVPPGAPVASNAVGVAYSLENKVLAVEPGSTAADAGVAAADRLLSAKIVYPKDKKSGEAPEPDVVELGDETSWPAVVDAAQFAPEGTYVEVQLNREGSKDPVTVKLVAKETEVLIAQRGLEFQPIFRTRQAESFAEAVRLGFDETTDSLLMVFRFLQKLGGQVPLKMLGGPGTIAVAAGDAASQGLSSLLIFLTMLSANLAVINFLPIPLLDGGHMAFLAYEGIRGRPANERVVLAMHMAGFAFIISLMVFVIGLDIQRFL